MPGVITPSSSSNPILQGVLDLSVAGMEGFIGDQVFPAMGVNLQSSVFKRRAAPEINKKPELSKRANGMEAVSDETRFTEDTYSTNWYGRKRVITDRERDDYMGKFGIDLYDVTRRDMLWQVAAVQEVLVAAATFNTTTLPLSGTTGHTVSAAWSSTSTSLPVDDVNTAKAGIEARTGGLQANTLVLDSMATARNLVMSDQVRTSLGLSRNDAANLTSAMTAQKLAAIFDVQTVAIANAWGVNGYQPSGSLAALWTAGYAFVGYVDRTPNPLAMSFGRSLYWNRKGGQFYGTEYREDKLEAQIFEVNTDVDVKVFNSACGYLIDIVP